MGSSPGGTTPVGGYQLLGWGSLSVGPLLGGATPVGRLPAIGKGPGPSCGPARGEDDASRGEGSCGGGAAGAFPL